MRRTCVCISRCSASACRHRGRCDDDRQRGARRGIFAIDLVSEGIYPISAVYLITEIRGGSHQIWMVEESLSDIDRINGVTFQRRAYIAIRGFARGRNVFLSKDYNSAIPPLLREANRRQRARLCVTSGLVGCSSITSGGRRNGNLSSGTATGV